MTSDCVYLNRDVVLKILEKYKSKKTVQKIRNHIVTMPTVQLPVPRVLSLDEAIKGKGVYYLELRCSTESGWVKCDFSKMDEGEVIMLFSMKKFYRHQISSYLDAWRLWNEKPTKERSDMVPWKGESWCPF